MSEKLMEYDYDILFHTLGIQDLKDKPYRNNFVAGDGHHDMPSIQRLCDAGFMDEREKISFLSEKDRVFFVTEEGKKEAFYKLFNQP